MEITDIPAQIRASRAARRWSQQQLAEATGFSRRTVGTIENGGNTTVDVLQSIADALSVELVIRPRPAGDQ